MTTVSASDEYPFPEFIDKRTPTIVDDLMNELLRPSFVWTMAGAMEGKPESTPAQLKSAKTRRFNAARQIDEIVRRYVERTS